MLLALTVDHTVMQGAHTERMGLGRQLASSLALLEDVKIKYLTDSTLQDMNKFIELTVDFYWLERHLKQKSFL